MKDLEKFRGILRSLEGFGEVFLGFGDVFLGFEEGFMGFGVVTRDLL